MSQVLTQNEVVANEECGCSEVRIGGVRTGSVNLSIDCVVHAEVANSFLANLQR